MGTGRRALPRQMRIETARRALAAHLAEPVAGALARLGVPANAVTLLGLVVAGASAYLTSVGYLMAGGVVLLASGAFDMLDGPLASASGGATRAGALLDSTVDRVSETVALLGILVFYLDEGSDPGVVLAYLTLAGSLMVSYLRARSEGLGIEGRVGIITRPERVVALGVGLMLGHWWVTALTATLALIAFLSLATALERLISGLRHLGRGG